MYGLTISGYIIDNFGVKFSMTLGMALMMLTKFLLVFIDN
jgi:hypothetical protein